MPIIVAHKETCEIVTKGPTLFERLYGNTGRVVARPCTCNGILVKYNGAEK